METTFRYANTQESTYGLRWSNIGRVGWCSPRFRLRIVCGLILIHTRWSNIGRVSEYRSYHRPCQLQVIDNYKLNLGNASIIKSWAHSFSRSLKFLSNCKHFDDLEHIFRSLNACIYYEISVSVWRIIKKWFNDGRIVLNLFNDIGSVSLTKINVRKAESVEQDQTARTLSA